MWPETPHAVAVVALAVVALATANPQDTSRNEDVWAEDELTCPGVRCPQQGFCRSAYGFCGPGPSYCNGKSTWTPTGCPGGNGGSNGPSSSGTSCPAGLSPYADTPSPALCSCGKSWAEANRNGVRCTSDNKPPPPTPPPPSPPSPSPPPPPLPSGAVVGIYDFTWDGRAAQPPPGANIGVAFSGWADVNRALADSAKVVNTLPGSRYLSLGGGNSNGHLNVPRLNLLASAIKAGKLKGYSGVCYDVEEGDAGMAAAFAASFALCKQHSLRVLVTVSHSAPYAVPDKAALMAGFLQDSNIDYLSPQLYTSGRERENDFAFTADFPWTRYKGMKPALVP
eukprot:TRINITY_DN12878_c0_g1_i21.p1 TRINITY_DN12878_c0_g1~~TRINITY_DN12878_c0_g1_i21.p1  ORF type:complete len:338 (+),score=69.14 TRINITY_DN12878_c0_g1_i21:181-1194(+)